MFPYLVLDVGMDAPMAVPVVCVLHSRIPQEKELFHTGLARSDLALDDERALPLAMKGALVVNDVHSFAFFDVALACMWAPKQTN